MTRDWWLLLEKSDETRVSKGIDAYRDQTGQCYQYDSKVPNHKNLKAGDAVVIRKESAILGAGLIRTIEVHDTVKTHRRCPQCNCTDIRERKRLQPKWKCGRCAHKFQNPRTTQGSVKSYAAAICGFEPLKDPPTVRQVKACAITGDGGKSQHSIIRLDAVRLAQLLGEHLPAPSLFSRGETQAPNGQGFGLSAEQRRAVEIHAMAVTADLYARDGWLLEDVSGTKPFDFIATRDGERLFIEVKGTTGWGDTIMLTSGEVEHARKNRSDTVLIVVVEVVLDQVDGVWRATGGRVGKHLHPWSPDAERLAATEYRYDLHS